MNNKGTLGRGLIIVLAILGMFVFFGVVMVGWAVGTYNGAVTAETGIKAQYTQNQNNYDNYFKKLKEAAQVPDMYAGDLEKIYSKVVEGRKGSETELVRMITEQNPTVDSTLYKQIQQIIEAGRNSFEADQKSLIDRVRAYETMLGVVPGTFLLGAMGFPKIDMAKYTIVTSEETATAFETKKSAPLKIKD